MKSFMENAQEYAETEATIADFTKGVSVVCSGFQLISLGLRLVMMATEVSRGQHVLPDLRSKSYILLRSVAEAMMELFDPTAQIHPHLIANIFKIQQKSLDTLAQIEE